jgi:hypothetical protein
LISLAAVTCAAFLRCALPYQRFVTGVFLVRAASPKQSSGDQETTTAFRQQHPSTSANPEPHRITTNERYLQNRAILQHYTGYRTITPTPTEASKVITTTTIPKARGPCLFGQPHSYIAQNLESVCLSAVRSIKGEIPTA